MQALDKSGGPGDVVECSLWNGDVVRVTVVQDARRGKSGERWYAVEGSALAWREDQVRASARKDAWRGAL
jgi:hypothetical protein